MDQESNRSIGEIRQIFTEAIHEQNKDVKYWTKYPEQLYIYLENLGILEDYIAYYKEREGLSCGMFSQDTTGWCSDVRCNDCVFGARSKNHDIILSILSGTFTPSSRPTWRRRR